jgi:glycerol-3-phosphate responsive antiterminator
MFNAELAEHAEQMLSAVSRVFCVDRHQERKGRKGRKESISLDCIEISVPFVSVASID